VKAQKMFPKVPYTRQSGRHGEIAPENPPYTRYEIAQIQKSLVGCVHTAACPRCHQVFALVKRTCFGTLCRESWLADCATCQRHSVIPVHRDPEPDSPRFQNLTLSGRSRFDLTESLARVGVAMGLGALIMMGMANDLVTATPIPEASFDTTMIVFATPVEYEIPEVRAVALPGMARTEVIVPQVVPVEIPAVDISAGAPNATFGIEDGGLETSSFAGLLSAPEVDEGPVELAALDQQPELVAAGRLRYPHDLRTWGVEGAVVVEFVLDTTGMVEPNSVTVVHSDNEGFDRAAMDAIKESVYRPGHLNGRPVRVSVSLTVNFTISTR
jgi:TonB family protein